MSTPSVATTSAELGYPPEMIMDLFRGIRARNLTTVEQVKALSLELYPEVPPEQHQACLVDLANRLTRDLSPGEILAARRHLLRRRSA